MTRRLMFKRSALRLLMGALDELPKRPECSETHIPYDDKYHSAIDVKLTQEILIEAAEIAEAKYEAAKRQGLKERIESTPLRRQTGELGPFAVSYCLWKDEHKILTWVRYGEPDICDMEFNRYKIDIKTFSWIGRHDNPEAWLFIPINQFQQRYYPYYIACQRITEDTIRILGFISRQILKDRDQCPNFLNFYLTPIGVPKLNLLTPIKDLESTLEQVAQSA